LTKIDDIVKTKFKSDKHRFITNIIYTSNCFQNMVSDYLKPYDLSIQQLNILRILKGAGDWVSMNDVKQLMIDKTPNTTRLVDKLLNKELVKRERCEEDRRLVFVSISEKGLELVNTIGDMEDAKHTKLFDNITEEEAKLCTDVIDKFRG